MEEDRYTWRRGWRQGLVLLVLILVCSIDKVNLS